MKYYLLKTLEQTRPEFCVLLNFPEDMGLKSWKLGDGVELQGDEYPQGAKIFMSDEEPGIEIPDLIPNTVQLLIVSKRLRDGMEEINRGPVQYLPLSIYNHKKRLASSDYFIVNPLGTVDVLDTSASEIEYLDGKVVQITHYVLDPKKIAQAPDLFRLKEEPESYVVSERVLDAWRKIVPKPTNITFFILDVPAT
ncbi:hypothetical protein OV208_28510 [Corallococcus sp. bb12-1]|uniref:imm11 family protein n=1 Tax=Corallococcus sp. bb12-1 TaxID=2996784 RepID=UPI00226E3717|nr:DUF1629 domain-containing protein [Corallococcus sp. bb12-1]MCY1045292.1 hypothetical protein [Corallococcus sp. bb12-1]